MKVYVFRVRLEWDEPVWRIIEIGESQTLHDLHLAIQDAFGWDNDHLYSFYMSGRAWDRGSEYSGDPLAGAVADRSGRFAEESLLSQLGLLKGRKFLYLFDYGDQWRHEVEVAEIVEREGAGEQAKIVEKCGESPDQYGDDDSGDEEITPEDALKTLGILAPLAERVRQAVEEAYGEDEKKWDLKKEYALAMELYMAVRQYGEIKDNAPESRGIGKRFLDELKTRIKPADPLKGETAQEVLDLFDVFAEYDLKDWLRDMPRELAEEGYIDDAAEHCQSWSQIFDAGKFLDDRAEILAEAGRRAEALEQARGNIQRFADDAWIQIRSGRIFAKFEEFSLAESCYRRAMAAAKTEPDYKEAVGELIHLLKKTGRIPEAQELEDAEAPRRAQDLHCLRRWEPYLRPCPKIGRNDPCSCGSGKKYKKCCFGKEKSDVEK
ncbi:MAG: SEC-C domain-containing protein [Elusimicrobia bacterium]|nr:SEC-C domain-containing protein [Elusimicrobiota bacterium]